MCAVVNENLRLVEAQLNSFKQKTGSIMKSSSALANLSEPQVNEEGLPIMDIREELPDNYDELKKRQQKQIQPATVASSDALPESVLRARAMMKEADEKISQHSKDTENKALFDLLRELEEEEEEEEEEEVQEQVVSPPQKDTIRHNDEESDDMDSFSDDSEDDDRYDTEISDNMFDRFGDDEQYPLDGTVDQEDFTAYNEIIPQIIPASSIKEIIEEDEYEKSTPKVITKRKNKVQVLEPEENMKETANPFEEEPEPTKKMSKFKLAQQQQKKAVETTIKENVTPEVVPDVNAAVPKKFSKFKLLRQQQKPRSVTPPPQVVEKVETPVATVVEEHIAPQEELEDEFIQPPKPSFAVADNGIPKVVPNKPKKMSRFKLTRQKTADEPVTTELDAPVQPERIKPKRTVTWDSDISIRDHDTTCAPSVVSETTSYSQPMKNESSSNKSITKSVFKQMRQAACAAGYEKFEDDYPSLDEESDVKVDLNELVQEARKSSEAFWRPNDGSEALIPIVNDDDDDEEEEPTGIIVAKKNKLDNKIMKGAVMERDIVPVDLEQVEDDMDIREVREIAHSLGLVFLIHPFFFI